MAREERKMQYRAPLVPPMLISNSSTNAEIVFDRFWDERESGGWEERKESTNEAPDARVVPQSPSPTRVSYCVIVGSEVMSLSQPVVIIVFMVDGEGRLILVVDECVGLESEELVCDSAAVGFGSGER